MDSNRVLKVVSQLRQESPLNKLNTIEHESRVDFQRVEDLELELLDWAETERNQLSLISVMTKFPNLRCLTLDYGWLPPSSLLSELPGRLDHLALVLNSNQLFQVEPKEIGLVLGFPALKSLLINGGLKSSVEATEKLIRDVLLRTEGLEELSLKLDAPEDISWP
ncbi:hypothetical protein MMC10_002716 [Thelotrema lepadinum]|nr:hypothetical protein [Thelotrema lepadinum]